MAPQAGTIGESTIQHPRVLPHEEWVKARVALMAKEKEFTRLRDELNRERRQLPWEKVTKSYVFDGPNGKETLADLFHGRSQLVVYHLMYAPSWDEACRSCSFWADDFNGIDIHLAHRDITLLAISRAPLAKLEAYRKRMGWTFKWVSSGGNDFNYDLGVSFAPEAVKNGSAAYNYGTIPVPGEEMPGVSVFYRDAKGDIYHTYSAYSRGIDILNGAYHYIDLTPKGRDEGEAPMAWLRRHDQYQD
ncbi:MAG TPA: thioredoxin family protein [Gemmatimonadales bacterium]|nr:thioredoxin family protein [Gemmatimonadales bacterium]